MSPLFGSGSRELELDRKPSDSATLISTACLSSLFLDALFKKNHKFKVHIEKIFEI